MSSLPFFLFLVFLTASMIERLKEDYMEFWFVFSILMGTYMWISAIVKSIILYKERKEEQYKQAREIEAFMKEIEELK